MKAITRVQELQNLKEEALSRIRAVLDLREDRHYYLYKLRDENLEEIAKNAPIYTDRIRRLVFAVYGLYLTGQKDAIALEMYSFNNQERNIVTVGNLDPHYDALMILAIADRIDELEGTGIHAQPDINTLLNKHGKVIFKALRSAIGSDIPDMTLVNLIYVRPKIIQELEGVSGVTPEIITEYGSEIIATLNGFSVQPIRERDTYTPSGL